MIFQVIEPFVVDIYGDSFKEAVKNYVKVNHAMNINRLIIKDQNDHYEARLRYYKENNKNKVGIDVYPYTNITPIAPIIPIVNPLPVIQSNVPVTFAPSVVPIAPINGPLITTKGSSMLANSNSVFFNLPRFY